LRVLKKTPNFLQAAAESPILREREGFSETEVSSGKIWEKQ
jgi:hypothetical protein